MNNTHHVTSYLIYTTVPSGPWAMSMTVNTATKYGKITRIAVIAGASNSDSRGLQIFPSLSAYNCMDRSQSLLLMYKEMTELPPKHKRSVKASGVKLSAKRGGDVQCPVFVSVGGMAAAEEDMIW